MLPTEIALMAVLEYVAVVAIVGWPSFILGGVASFLAMRFACSISSLRAASYALLAMSGAVLLASVAWKLWIPEFGGPMFLGGVVHGPSLLAALLACPIVCWVAVRHAT